MQKQILLLLLICIFASCKTVETKKPKDFKNLTLQDFYGEEWEFDSFRFIDDDVNIGTAPEGNQRFTLIFKDGNTIAGKSFCNSYFGNYKVKGDSIRFSNIGSTKMFCGDKSSESHFFNELADVTSFVLYKSEAIQPDKFRLVFYNIGRTKALWFTRDTAQSF